MTEKDINKTEYLNKKITFEDFDKLDLKPFGKTIVEIIENDKSDPIDQIACTISLNAEFGQGKTIFLKMLKNFIEDEKNDDYTVLFIDVWKEDFLKDPLTTIILELLEKDENKNVKNKKNILKIIGKTGNNLINQLLKKQIGIDLKKVKEEEIGESFLKEFKQKKEILREIKDVISGYTKDGKKLMIIVDELDRTRPDYAVHFLEDMKHFFDIENVVFIFGINKKQMEATVKTLYGEKLNFEGYYRKFFKHEMDLTDPYIQALNLIDNLLKKTKVNFNDLGEIQYTHSNTNVEEQKKSHIKNTIFDVYLCCKIFNLTLREINNFLRIFEYILSNEKEKGPSNYYVIIISFFICLYMKKQNIFQDILYKNLKYTDFLNLEFIRDKRSEKDEISDSEEKVLHNFFAPHILEHMGKNLLNKAERSKKYPQDVFPLLSKELFSEKIRESKENILFLVTACIGKTNDWDDIKKSFESVSSSYPNLMKEYNVGQAINICQLIEKRQSAFTTT